MAFIDFKPSFAKRQVEIDRERLRQALDQVSPLGEGLGAIPSEQFRDFPIIPQFQRPPLTMGAATVPRRTPERRDELQERLKLVPPDFEWKPRFPGEIPTLDDLVKSSKIARTLGIESSEELIGEWIMPAAIFQGLPPAMAGWRAVAPWIAAGGAKKVAGITARTLLAPLAGPEALTGFLARGAGKGAKLVAKPIVEKLATKLQKIEGHRVARSAGLLNAQGKPTDAYRKLAMQIAGKGSMKDMTLQQADDFIQAMGGNEVRLPTGLSPSVARKRTSELVNELVEYIAPPVKEVKVVTSPSMKPTLGERIGRGFSAFLERTYRMERRLLSMDRFTEGGKMQQVFWNPIRNADDTVIRNEAKFLDDFRNVVTANRVNLGRLLNDPIQIDPKVTVTGADRIGFYLHSLNPDNLRHLKYGNLRAHIFGEDWADDVIRKTINSMTPEERNIANWLRPFFEKDSSIIANIYKSHTGKTLNLVENYVPIRIKDDPIQNIDALIAKEGASRFARKFAATGVSKRFTRPRTGKAEQSIETNAVSLFLRHLHETEHYKAFNPVVTILDRIIKTPKFRQAMITKYNKATYDVLEQWLKDVARTNPNVAVSQSEKVLQYLRVNAVTGALGLNVVTAMKQFPSFVAALPMAGHRNAMRGLFAFSADRKGTEQLMRQYAPQIWKRTMVREVAESQLMKGLEKRALGKISRREMLMFFTLQTDKLAVGGLWRGVYDNGIRKGLAPQKAADAATRVITRTQPMFSIKDVPEFWRAGEGLKMLTVFTNQLNQYWNYFRFDVFGKYVAGKMSNARLLQNVVESFIIPSLMIGAISKSRLPESTGEAIKDLATTGLGTIPIAGSILSSGLKGFASSAPITFQPFIRMGQAITSISKGDILKSVARGAEAGGFLAGAPVIQLRRSILAMLELAEGKSEDWLRLIWGGYTREKAEKEAPGGIDWSKTKRPSGGGNGGPVDWSKTKR